MAAWHGSWKGDVGLRLLGLLACGVGYLALSRLFSMRQAAHDVSLLTFSLAALGFLSASAGGALTWLGHHLFDEIEVSSRWRRRSPAQAFPASFLPT